MRSNYLDTVRVVHALQLDHQQSDRTCAAALGVDRRKVQRIRAALVSRGEIPRASERRQADGTFRVVPREGAR